jgi:hypothetical protein
MNAATKRTRRAIFKPLLQHDKSSRPLHDGFRRLKFESLEQRVYLAVDVTIEGPVAAVESSTTTVPRIFTFAPTAPKPYLKPIGNFEFDNDVTSFEIPLVAENVADESIVFVAEAASGNTASFETEVLKVDANHARLTVRLGQEYGVFKFNGALVIRVGILRENQTDSEPWIDMQQFRVYINNTDDGPTADLSLTATTLSGSPITKLRPGDGFILHVWAQDLRSIPKGLFAAYLNINWNGNLAVTTGDIQHGERFFNGQAGDLSQSGLISEAGGFGGMAQSDGKRYELFNVPMRATSAGELSLEASPTTYLPAHEYLAHGLDGGIGPSQIQFGKLNLTIAERSPTDPPDDGGQGTTDPSDPITGSDPQLPPLNPPPPHELPADSSPGTIVGFGVTVTAPDGTPLQKPRAGDDFVLHVWVKDVRQIPGGVLAAFLNVNWDAKLAVATGPLSYGERYVNPWPQSTVGSGAIEEAGGVEEVGHSQGEWLELFNIPLHAKANGELSFTTSPSTDVPNHDILVNGLDGGIDRHAVYYGQFSLTIGVGEPSTGTEGPPAAVSAPESPVGSAPAIAEVPIIVAISDDSEGGQFAVSVLELLSPEMQAEFANGLAASKLSVKDNNSRAALLNSSHPGDVADQSPLSTTNRETDLDVVSRKTNADSTADALANQAVTAKTDLSLL